MQQYEDLKNSVAAAVAAIQSATVALTEANKRIATLSQQAANRGAVIQPSDIAAQASMLDAAVSTLQAKTSDLTTAIAAADDVLATKDKAPGLVKG